jgi:SAM-dependent methyltransferase
MELPAHTGRSYDEIASKYADAVEVKPFTRLFERPAFLSQLPSVTGLNVLDAGCGPGWYSEFLLGEGTQVTACDFNEEFVRRTQERLSNKARVLQADLSKPLEFPGEAFDLIICSLVMHYLKYWRPALREFSRVLRRQGLLVLSTHHPFMDWQQFKTESYFGVDLVEDEWDVGKVTFFRRLLTLMSDDLEAAGFVTKRIHEPQPLAELESVDSALFERLRTNPYRLIVRARKG